MFNPYGDKNDDEGDESLPRRPGNIPANCTICGGPNEPLRGGAWGCNNNHAGMGRQKPPKPAPVKAIKKAVARGVKAGTKATKRGFKAMQPPTAKRSAPRPMKRPVRPGRGQ